MSVYQENTDGFAFLMIPQVVAQDKRLKGNEKLLYGHIFSLTKKEGYCWATNDYLADLMGVSKDCISRYITHIIELGYLDRVVVKDKKSGQITCRKLYIKNLFADPEEDESEEEKAEESSRSNDQPSIPNDQGVLVKRSIPYRSNDQGGIGQTVGENNITEYISEYINKGYAPPRVREALMQFCTMRMEMARRDKRKPFTVSAFKLILKRLDELAQNDEEKIAILNNSVMNNWQGVFPLKGGEIGRQGSRGLRDGTYEAYINSAITNDTFGRGMS